MVTINKTENYTIFTSDLIEQASTGYFTVRCKVKGFWSNEQMSFYYRRRGEGNWVGTFSSSSGGRDEKEVESDLEAYSYFAEAMGALIEFSKIIDVNQLEEEYLAAKEKYIKDRELEKAKLQAEIDADIALSLEEANSLLDKLKSKELTSVSLFKRGSNQSTEALRITHDGYFQNYGKRIARSKLLEDMVKHSSKIKYI